MKGTLQLLFFFLFLELSFFFVHSESFFSPNEKIALQVSHLTSSHSYLPLPPERAPLCWPQSSSLLNLYVGDQMLGHRTQNTNFEFRARVNETCKILCGITLTSEEETQIKQLIDGSYSIYFLFSGHPVITTVLEKTTLSVPIGYKLDSNIYTENKNSTKYYLFNHFSFSIYYTTTSKGIQVKSVAAKPLSLTHAANSPLESNCVLSISPRPLSQSRFPKYDTLWMTFDTTWLEVDEKEEPLEKSILKQEATFYWGRLKRSLLVVITSSLLFWYMVLRNFLNPSFRKIHTRTFSRQIFQSSAFKASVWSGFLWAFICGGLQLLFTVFSVIGVSGLFGLRVGEALTFSLLVWSLSGALYGTLSAFTADIFGKHSIEKLSLVVPGILFSLYLVLNYILHQEGSSAGISFTLLFWILLLIFSSTNFSIAAHKFFSNNQDTIDSAQSDKTHATQTAASADWWKKYVGMFQGFLAYLIILEPQNYYLTAAWNLEGISYILSPISALTWLSLSLIVTVQGATTMSYFSLLEGTDSKWGWRVFGTGASVGGLVHFYNVLFFWIELSPTVGVLSTTAIYFYVISLMVSTCVALSYGSLGFLISLFVTSSKNRNE